MTKLTARLAACLTTICLSSSCASGPQETATPAPQSVSEAIEQAAAPLLRGADPKLPALLVATTRNGAREIAIFGDSGGVTADSAFRIGDLSRTFAALLVASYTAEGVLKWDEPVSVGSCTPKQLSAFCFRGTATNYRNLVQHTAGLPAEPAKSGADYTASNLQDLLAHFEVPIEPGKRFRYSATGYATLGMMLERRTRTPYADALNMRVLAPLELTSTSFTPTGLAPGFRDGEPVPDAAEPTALLPASGLASTASDLLHFAELNLEPDAAGPLAAAIRETHRVSSEIEAFDDSRVTHGWFHVEASDTYWHAGSSAGYSAFLAFAPATNSAVVLLTNTSLQNDGLLRAAGFDLLSKLAVVP